MNTNLNLTPVKSNFAYKQESQINKKRKCELQDSSFEFKKNRNNNSVSKDIDCKINDVVLKTINNYKNLLNNEFNDELMQLIIKKESDISQTWIVYVKYKKIILDVIHMTKHNAECKGLKAHLLAKNINTEESQRRTKGSKDNPQSPPMRDWKGVFNKIVLEYETFKENNAIPKGILYVDYNGKKVQYHFSNLDNNTVNKWPRIASLDRLNYI